MYLLLTSRHFVNSRNVLERKSKFLRGPGKPNKSYSLSNDKIEQLCQSRQFDYHSPIALIDTLWWLLKLQFGFWGCQEHQSIKIEDFTFKRQDGFSYLTSCDWINKTRQSGLCKKYRVQIPKMFETRNDPCPVKISRTYLAKRPAELWTAGPFYLVCYQ